MQAWKGPPQLSLVDGVSVLLFLSVVPIMCAPILLLQVRYPLVWSVGAGNIV